MWKSFLEGLRASLWNCYQETIPSVPSIGTVVFYAYCLYSCLYIVASNSCNWILRWIRLKSRLVHDMASSLSRKETPVERVERRTRRSVAIETSLTEDNLAKCYHQSQSPLFQLPRELRDLIFEYASTQSEDPNYHYENTSYYYRSGHKARHKTHTSFLFSCRRVWLEAHATPMQRAEHTFWFQRGPYDQRSKFPSERHHYEAGCTGHETRLGPLLVYRD